MSPAEAAKLLDLPVDATAEQLEARFFELRRKLEDKIGKAPTPGLQAKYRASLADITEAFETLTLAADSSHLPVLNWVGSSHGGASAPASPGGHEPAKSTAPAAPVVKAAASPKKPHSRHEFAIVLVIALLLLGGGGWWVVKTRQEAAERARLEAEALALAKAEAERKAAAEKAEAERVAKLAALLGAQLAELKVEWETHEAGLADAERRASDLKAEARDLAGATATVRAEQSAQFASQELFSEWLKDYLMRHPAKVARARAEQLLAARAFDEAKTACEELAQALAGVGEEIELRRRYFFTTTGAVRIESEPAGLRWTFTDAFGRKSEGVTPAQINDLPPTHLYREKPAEGSVMDAPVKLGDLAPGKVTVTFARTGWKDEVVESVLIGGETKVLRFGPYPEGSFEVSSLPSGLPWEATNELGWKASGVTPSTIQGVPPGRLSFTSSRRGYVSASGSVEIVPDESRSVVLDQRGQTMTIAVEESDAEIWVGGRRQGRGTVKLDDLALGDYDVELRLAGSRSFATRLSVKPGVKVEKHSFSFRTMNEQKYPCKSCDGRGEFDRSRQCGSCSGQAIVDCSNCSGRGYVINYAAVFANGMLDGLESQQPRQETQVTCHTCSGRGTVTCRASGCRSGTYYWKDPCSTCSGDGRLSQMDLAAN